MTVVPGVRPLTTPDAAPTDATGALLLLHTPPDTVFPKVTDAPWQTDVGPEIAEGAGSIVITADPIILLLQPGVEVANTVYVPAAVIEPKLKATPAPPTGEPTVDDPLYN